jgi:hypothetical protein
VVAVALSAAVAGAALVISLQVDNGWLLHQQGDQPSLTESAQRWFPIVGILVAALVTLGVLGVLLWVGISTLASGGQLAFPVTIVLVVAAVAAGVLIASPGLPSAPVLLGHELPGGDVVFADGFSRDRRDWTRRSTRSSRVLVQKGVYQMVLRKPNATVSASSATVNRRLQPTSDVLIDLTTRRPSGRGDGRYGVLCRYESNSRYYAVAIGADGRFRVDKRLDDRTVELQGWRTSAALKATGRNRLRVACIGGQQQGPVLLALWANGREVTQVVDRGRLYLSGPTLTRGSVRLFAAPSRAPLDVRFDNLTVHKLDRLAWPG